MGPVLLSLASAAVRVYFAFIQLPLLMVHPLICWEELCKNLVTSAPFRNHLLVRQSCVWANSHLWIKWRSRTDFTHCFLRTHCLPVFPTLLSLVPGARTLFTSHLPSLLLDSYSTLRPISNVTPPWSRSWCSSPNVNNCGLLRMHLFKGIFIMPHMLIFECFLFLPSWPYVSW